MASDQDPLNPSPEAIDSLLSLFKERVNGRMAGGKRYCSLKDGRFVKWGEQVTISEAEAMMYMKKNTSIPIPQLYMAFQRDGYTYLVMEEIPGRYFRETIHFMTPENLKELGKSLDPKKDTFCAWKGGAHHSLGGYTDAQHEFKNIEIIGT
ncbi:hypothetical protein AX16_010264 [Volvariella volvacea WC 439]|nr:hypothetical protein AX16_010264 [Volvariella volvacea WC 439]